MDDLLSDVLSRLRVSFLGHVVVEPPQEAFELRDLRLVEARAQPAIEGNR